MTVEHWLPVVGYEGRYEVSDQGRVRSLVHNHTDEPTHVLKPRPSKRGYGYVRLVDANRGKRNRSVHRLVARAFVGVPPEGCEVAHKNHDPSDCRLANLEYVTHAENIRQSVAAGRFAHGKQHHWHRNPLQGERHPFAKLTAEIVREIRRLDALGVKQRVIAQRFGMKAENVSKVVTRTTWASVV